MVTVAVKAVIFDLDGTLLNTLTDIANAVNYTLKKNVFPTHPTEAFKRFVGNGTDIMISRALPPDARNDKTLDALRPGYLEYYDAHSNDNTRPYDGIPELLRDLKARGVKLAVTSNKIDCMVQLIVSQYFKNTFDYVTGQKEHVPIKPDPAMVFAAMESFGVTPTECVYVGDSGVDARTGSNSGAFTVGVSWGFRTVGELLEGGADAIISKPAELLRYVR